MSENKSSKSKHNKCKKNCSGCLNYMYNREEGTVFGRTGKSWFLLFIFYVIFFSVLAGFFALLLYIFMTVLIKDSNPYLTGEHSLLGSRAGLNVHPRMAVEEALIIISSNPKDIQNIKYEKEINNLFGKNFGQSPNNATSCPSGSDQPNDVNNFCVYNKNELGPCIDPIGQMQLSKLCVFIRVNKVFGWLPDVMNTTTSSGILIDCVGQNPGDVVNLRQPTYYPSFHDGMKSYGVIHNKYFPFINQRGYVSPMVAVQFPDMKNNTAILLQCQIINLRNSFKNVKFEVMVLNRRE